MASTIKVNFIGDNKDLNRAIDDTDGKFGKFGSSIGSFAKTAGLALGGAAVVAGAALFKMAEGAAEDEKAATALAKTLENVTGQTGAAAKGLEDWISAQGKAFGVADDDLRPALDSLIRGTKDLDAATELSTLAMDISAATGKDLTSVADALSKAYNGQLGPLKKLDPALAGLVKEGASADEVFGALSKTFEGQAAAAADTTAGKLKIAKLQFSEMQEEIGAKVIPVLAKLATWVNTSLLPALQRLGAWLGEVLPPIISAVQGWIQDSLIPALRNIGEWIQTNVIPALQAMAQWIVDNVIPAVQSFANWIRDELVPVLMELWASFEKNILPVLEKVSGFIVDKVLPVLAQIGQWIVQYVLPFIGELVKFILGDLIPAIFIVVGWIADKLLPVFEAIAVFIRDKVIPAVVEVSGFIKNLGTDVYQFGVDALTVFTNLVSFITGMPGKISAAAKGMFDGIKDAFRSALNFVIDAWNGLEFKIPGFDPPGPGPSFGGFTLGVPDIPRLAKGGIVTSPTLALIGEAGPEAVVPLGRGGGMGATVNVYALDPRTASELVVAALRDAGIYGVN